MSTKAQQKPTAKGPLKPKNMSSRLLTMKFMQRGVAASSTSSSGKSKDSKDGSNSITDRKAEKAALAAAIAEEERIKAEAARKRQEIVGVREDEETPWELAVIGVKDQGLNVKVMGHGELVEGEEDEDEEDDNSEEEEVGCGRFSFGQFNKMVDKLNGLAESSDSEEEEDEKSETKEASLKGLTQISGSLDQQARQRQQQRSATNAKCFNCDEVGHLAADCPNRKRGLKRSRSVKDVRGEYGGNGDKRRKSRP